MGCGSDVGLFGTERAPQLYMHCCLSIHSVPCTLHCRDSRVGARRAEEGTLPLQRFIVGALAQQRSKGLRVDG